MKKKGILLVIYVALNLVVIGIAIHIMFSATPMESIGLGVVLYAVSIGMAFSPVGEFIVRVKERARKDDTVLEVVDPLFKEVYSEAKKEYVSVPEGVKVLVNKGELPNACAIGRKTICVTNTITDLSDNEIKAVLSHELGHLINKDTYPIIFATTGNIVVIAIATIIKLVITFVQLLASIVCQFAGGTDGVLYSMVNAFLNLLINVFIDGILITWTKIGQLFVIGSTNKKELEADQVAVKIGYGKELCDVLRRYQPLAGREKKKAFDFTHTNLDERISRIVNNQPPIEVGACKSLVD